MKHKWFRKNIIRFIDKDLKDKDKSFFESHIFTCEKCKNDYDLVNNIVNWENNKKRIKVPEHLYQRIMNTINSKDIERKPGLPPYYAIKYSFVVILFLSIVVGTIYTNKIFSEKKNYNISSVVSKDYHLSNSHLSNLNITVSER
ncbi:MAG TPA: hypothetical protein VIR55_02100 [Ignavibacteria bacterium]